jgi:hypothetical protein
MPEKLTASDGLFLCDRLRIEAIVSPRDADLQQWDLGQLSTGNRSNLAEAQLPKGAETS